MKMSEDKKEEKKPEVKPNVDTATRTLVKTGPDEYTLTITTEDKKNISIGLKTKKQLKETYTDIKSHYHGVLNNINSMKKELKEMDEFDTPEMRELLDKLNKCAKLAQKEQFESQVKSLEIDLDRARKEKKIIEILIPEVLRNKK